jgi:hypothetical protein
VIGELSLIALILFLALGIALHLLKERVERLEGRVKALEPEDQKKQFCANCHREIPADEETIVIGTVIPTATSELPLQLKICAVCQGGGEDNSQTEHSEDV